MSTLLEQASLVMIPSGYKEDVVYSQIPTNGAGDLSFTRASNGTRINSAGLVEVCPWNLWTDSNIFTSTNWNQYQLTPTTGTTSDIYGNSSTVYKLIGNVTNSYCFINRSSDGATNTAFSVYAKPNGYTKIGISNRSGGAWNFVVDLVTKVVSNIYDSASSIVSINVLDAVGDWKRIEVVVSTAIQYNLHPLPSNFNSTNFDNVTLNGTDGVWVMGAQVNIGSTAKPYFPTTDRLNVPRLTYQNGGGGCPSLLLEKQSTNYAIASQEFNNTSYWVIANSAVNANSTTSPDGTQNADLWYPSTNGDVSSRRLLQSMVIASSGVNVTATVYVKRNNKRWLFFAAPDATSANHNCWFDIQNGVVGTKGSAVISATIESVGNGWYRCGVTSLATSTTQYVFLSATDADADGTVTANGTDGMYFYGAQLEAGSYPTSYIPSTSSSATRVADACFKTGISSLIGQTEGTLFVDLKITALPTDGSLFGVQKTASNFVIRFGSQGSNIYAQCYNGSTNLFFETTSYTLGTRIKMAFAYKAGSYAFYINGTQIATGTNATSIPACDEIMTNSLWGNTNPSLYEINEAVLFPTRLTNAELASLTTI